MCNELRINHNKYDKSSMHTNYTDLKQKEYIYIKVTQTGKYCKKNILPFQEF